MSDTNTGRDKPEARQRIFEQARRLFAHQGFAATGVRQIAAEAGVNLAMINYFFGSKSGLLEAILEDFFNRLKQAVSVDQAEDLPAEDRFRRLIHALARFYQANTEGLLIAITEIAKDSPEVIELKARQVSQLPLLFATAARDFFGPHQRLEKNMVVIGPMIAAMTMSHYLTKPVVARTGLIDFDEGFYDRYPDIVADMALYGLTGLEKWRFGETSGDDK